MTQAEAGPTQTGSTTTDAGPTSKATRAAVPALTVLWHPDHRRVGHRALLVDAAFGRSVSLTREEPAFGPPSEASTDPLGHRSVSRTPLTFEDAGNGAVAIDQPSASRKTVVDGVDLEGRRVVTEQELDRGVVVELSSRVVLLLHRVASDVKAQPALGMVGHSNAVEQMRLQVLAVAPHDAPVLVSGETGVGKELVVRAIHENSKRADGPLVTVNMAAIPAGTAASALFGHRRGAFTGAVATERGYFRMAHGGTLFLDEVGATPMDVQGALLRVLDTGELQPLGSESGDRVDVRVIAATDADLDEAVEAGRFRLPLLHRLRGYELAVPPLRDRRDDVGRLLIKFLSEAEVPAEELAEAVPGKLVSAFARYEWPGNVRELRNVARRLVVGRGRADLGMDPSIERILSAAAGSNEAPVSSSHEKRRGRRRREDFTDDEVLDALRKTEYKPSKAAELLGVSRTTMYVLMERCDAIRKASSLPKTDISSALDAVGGDAAEAAAQLRVSERGLRLRMKQLGMTA